MRPRTAIGLSLPRATPNRNRVEGRTIHITKDVIYGFAPFAATLGVTFPELTADAFCVVLQQPEPVVVSGR